MFCFCFSTVGAKTTTVVVWGFVTPQTLAEGHKLLFKHLRLFLFYLCFSTVGAKTKIKQQQTRKQEQITKPTTKKATPQPTVLKTLLVGGA
jgi:hypothetical protein